MGCFQLRVFYEMYTENTLKKTPKLKVLNFVPVFKSRHVHLHLHLLGRYNAAKPITPAQFHSKLFFSFLTVHCWFHTQLKQDLTHEDRIIIKKIYERDTFTWCYKLSVRKFT